MEFINKYIPKINDKNHIIILKIYLFPVLYLHCFSVFSLVLESGDHSGSGVHTSHCGGFSCLAAQALERAGFSSFTSRLYSSGSGIETHGLSCPSACGILMGQATTCVSYIGQWTLYH